MFEEFHREGNKGNGVLFFYSASLQASLLVFLAMEEEAAVLTKQANVSYFASEVNVAAISIRYSPRHGCYCWVTIQLITAYLCPGRSKGTSS